MVEQSVEVALARVETKIEALRADLSRYFAELANQEERLRDVENKVVKLSERLAIATAGLATLQLLITAFAAWMSLR